MSWSYTDCIKLENLCLKVIAENFHKHYLTICKECDQESKNLAKELFHDLESENPIKDDKIDDRIQMLEEECCHSSKCQSHGASYSVVPANDSQPTEESGGYILTPELANKLVKCICKQGQLDDATALYLSNQKLFPFYKLYLKKCSTITSFGLVRLLQKTNLTEINIAHINSSNQSNYKQKITLAVLINSLNSWSKENITSVNISGMQIMEGFNKVVPYSNGYRFLMLCALQNLRTLDVSSSDFTDLDLGVITMNLQKLQHLNIACTQVQKITCFLDAHAPKLKSLIMYNLPKLNMAKESLFNVFCKMDTLQMLDISTEAYGTATNIGDTQINDGIGMMLIGGYALPHLKFLDISGRDSIEERAFMNFFINHPEIEFLGLLHTMLDNLPCFVNQKDPQYRSYVKVAGSQTEEQISTALRCYKGRPALCKLSLFNLFNWTQNTQIFDLNLVILMLKIMWEHIHTEPPVLLAATACVYNLTNRTLGHRIHVHILAKVVDMLLETMEEYMDNEQMQKNCLLTLCSDRILKEVKFNFFRAARLVMDCLRTHKSNQSMPRMAVAILSILAAKITTEETALLGRYSNMKVLVEIVREKLTSNEESDITLKFTLSALWNLTDESPRTCTKFVKCGGIALFNEILQKNHKNPCLQTKVLGLLNNLAEVSSLHKQLLSPEVQLLSTVFAVLDSQHIEVSYFAAGIISHLSMAPDQMWESYSLTENLKQKMLDKLYNSVKNWNAPQSEMVAYRTFKPFFSLLQSNYTAVLYWAGWAIDHVCQRNKKRYCKMLVEENAMEYVEQVLKRTNIDDKVRKLLTGIKQQVESDYDNEVLDMDWQ